MDRSTSVIHRTGLLVDEQSVIHPTIGAHGTPYVITRAVGGVVRTTPANTTTQSLRAAN